MSELLLKMKKNQVKEELEINEEWQKVIHIEGIEKPVILDDFAKYPMIEFLIKYIISDNMKDEKEFLLEKYNQLQSEKIDNILKEVISFNLVSAIYWYKGEKDFFFIDLERIFNLDKKEKKEVLNLFKEKLRLGVWKKNLMPKIYIEYKKLGEDIIQDDITKEYIAINIDVKKIRDYINF